MDVSFLGGPEPQRGVGIVAPFDFALDRELWRWVPDDVSLHLTRTPFVPVEVSLDLARLVSEHATLREAVQALTAVSPEVVAYACTSGSFVGGQAGEAAMSYAMGQAGETPALTTSGALLEALQEIGARRVALVTPYTKSVTDSLEEYLGEAGIEVTGRCYLGLTREIWRVPYRDVTGMAREATAEGEPDALFISCTNLPTYDAIPQLEAELRMPVLSANQVTVWSALRRIGKQAVGPYQALLDPVARSGPAAMSGLPAPAAPEPPPPDPEPEVALAGSALPGPETEFPDPLADPAGPDDLTGGQAPPV
ncbi:MULTISPECIES: maleate cis-trans isomerase family protein [unclassified Streptomyces]|uniref:maleate cis-trans isomerase family protein n=1 Tax=unclassified Streptomyces TaxID=2593676 RepID=UPI0022B62CEC|nr:MULTISPECIES: decarboxylase [unclassified Streptomyces]MCZ7414439.1 decarboxylase [Streptomyces sp. WMMC897]MCZ7431395.1 decarboxylase [Streptomyces sp. WMMC1477]